MAETALPTRPIPVQRTRPLWKEIARHWLDYLFIAPFFVSFALFSLYPLGWAVQLSFSRWRGFGPMTFVGWENYQVMFNDPYLVLALTNTLQFAYILLPTGIFLAIMLAVFLNIKNLTGRGVFRLIYFLPYITSTVIIAIVFTQLFDDEMGWINRGIEFIGLEPVRWLRGGGWAEKWVLIMLVHWGGIGYNVLLFLGGLQSIETELYEAARIDGANDWQIFWRITLPLLYPIIFFLVVIATIGLMNMFNQPYMLWPPGNGGRNKETMTLMLRLYELGIGGQRYGDASAFGIMIGALVILISIVQIRLLRRREM